MEFNTRWVRKTFSPIIRMVAQEGKDPYATDAVLAFCRNSRSDNVRTAYGEIRKFQVDFADYYGDFVKDALNNVS